MESPESPENLTFRRLSQSSASPRRFMSAPKLPAPSAAAVQLQKKNTLINKVKPFERLFAQTASSYFDKANTYKLADEVYTKADGAASPEKKRCMSSQQRTRASKSASKVGMDLSSQKVLTLSMIREIQAVNPASTVILSNLSQKTYQVPAINSQIYSLGEDKRQLQLHIAQLKRLINNEGKQRGKLNMKCKKHMNGIEKCNDLLFKNEVEMKRTFILLEQVYKECSDLKTELEILDIKNSDTLRCIQQDQAQIDELKKHNSNAKHSIIKQEKRLNDTKSNLTKALKIMNSHNNEIKYQQSEKAKVLLYIKEMTDINKVNT